MANKELIALLQSLQGPGAGGALNPGLLAQLPALIKESAASSQAAGAANTSNKLSTGAASLASAALRTAGSGLTLLPVVTNLLKLFGVGKRKEAEPAFEKYELPAPIRAEAGLSQSGETFLIDRGAGDRIRQLPLTAGTPVFGGTQPPAMQPRAGAAITVNVQAMDSQSFLDRREDIARAVREAMLQSHSLNDVVSEL